MGTDGIDSRFCSFYIWKCKCISQMLQVWTQVTVTERYPGSHFSIAGEWNCDQACQPGPLSPWSKALRLFGCSAIKHKLSESSTDSRSTHERTRTSSPYRFPLLHRLAKELPLRWTKSRYDRYSLFKNHWKSRGETCTSEAQQLWLLPPSATGWVRSPGQANLWQHGASNARNGQNNTFARRAVVRATNNR